MRENMGLYRGKRKDNGEWAEGNLFENDNSNYPMVLIGHVVMSRDKHTNELSFDGFGLYEVDPETVGQYTGLTDKNGVKIFEGDILRIIERGETIDGGIVAFRNEYPGGWLVMDKAYESKCSLAMRNDVEITGNIHDNPELLEVK